MHIKAMYEKAWNMTTNEEVHFLDDSACRDIIARTDAQLLKYFENDKKGANRSDICRIAALHESGGHYLDNDMGVMKVPPVPDGVAFASAWNDHSYQLEVPDAMQNTFLAAAPGHPILKKALRLLLDHYRGWHSLGGIGKHLGPSVLRDAYMSVSKRERGTVWMLWERNLWRSDYLGLPSETRIFPDVKRQPCWHANYVLVRQGTAYMYDRIPEVVRGCTEGERRAKEKLWRTEPYPPSMAFQAGDECEVLVNGRWERGQVVTPPYGLTFELSDRGRLYVLRLADGTMHATGVKDVRAPSVHTRSDL
jgi:hypothetical protein